jgi:hypothetical protein
MAAKPDVENTSNVNNYLGPKTKAKDQYKKTKAKACFSKDHV